MRRKAQATVLMAVMGIGFIGLGSYLGSITLSDTLTETVQINSGDVTVVMETKIRSDHYTEKTSQSLLYAYNTSTYRLGQKGGGFSEWTSDSPTRDQLESKLKNNLLEELRRRNKVAECQGPKIESVQATRTETKAELEGNITCTGSNTKVDMPAPDNVSEYTRYNGYYGEEPEQAAGGVIWNYGLIGGGILLTEEIERQVDQEEFTDKVTGACGEEYSTVKEEVREETESEASNHYSSIEVDGSQLSRHLIDTLSFEVESNEITAGSHDTSQTDSVRCEEDCVEVEGGEGCIPKYDQKLTVEDTYSPSELKWDLLLTESREIITAEGEQVLELDYSYLQDLSG